MSRMTIDGFNSSIGRTTIGVLPLMGWCRPRGSSWLYQEVDAAKTEDAEVDLDQDKLRLDPLHGFLVKSLQNDTIEFAVNEFGELEPGIWGPMNGVYDRAENGGMNRTTWEVQSFTVNEVIQPSEFLPPKPSKGAVVEDRTERRTYRHDFRQWDRLDEPARQGKTLHNLQGRNAFTGRPPTWWFIRFGVLVLALALVGKLAMAYRSLA